MIRLKTRGLDDLDADIQRVERRFVDGVRSLENELADETAVEARRRAGRDSKSGRAADSIRAMGPSVEAGIGVPYYAFFDFGGKVGIRKSVSRPFIRGGRYLMKAASEIGVMRRADRMMEDTTKGFG